MIEYEILPTKIISKPISCSETESLFLPNTNKENAPSFYQVRLHNGEEVPLKDIEQALSDLNKLSQMEEEKKNDTRETENRIWFWAADGTLLNLMRWGYILNDNDVDISFAVIPKTIIRNEEDFENEERLEKAVDLLKNAMVNKTKQREWYVSLMFALNRVGIVELPTSASASDQKEMARLLKNLRNPFKHVKPSRCHIRRGFMQCRHKNGVLYDFFGPENSFVGKFSEKKQKKKNQDDINLLKQQYFPLRKCRSFKETFPCPKNGLKILKSWTLDYSDSHQPKNENNNQNLFEFAGCTLFTRKKQEHDKEHLQSVLKSAKALYDCGYPSLWEDRLSSECDKMMKNAGL